MGHTEYELNGEVIPSVTQVLSIVNKPFLLFWYGKHGTAKCEAIKKESTDFGTEFHDVVESRLLGRTDAISTNTTVQKAVVKFMSWVKKAQFKPTALEQKVVSTTHKFHGTFDAIGTLGSEGPYVFDWKTSNQIDDLYAVQLSAYAAAYKEQGGPEVKGGVVVRVAKDASEVEVKTYTKDHLDKCFEVFLAAKRVYEFVNKKGDWTKPKRRNGTVQ